MLLSNKAIQNANEGFQTYMREETVRAAGMNPRLEFKSAGVEGEPIRTWDETKRRYVDPIVGYRYPVMQDTTDEDSNVYRQNPIMVRVDGDLVNLKFGDKVIFDDLLGYRNKSYKYSFQAAAIRKVKQDDTSQFRRDKETTGAVVKHGACYS